MNITRQVTKTEIDVPTVDSIEEAVTVRDHILAGHFSSKEIRDAANGLVEAFCVSFLRKSAKNSLASDVATLTSALGADYNPLQRALARVKDFRPKNRAWR